MNKDFIIIIIKKYEGNFFSKNSSWPSFSRSSDKMTILKLRHGLEHDATWNYTTSYL